MLKAHVLNFLMTGRCPRTCTLRVTEVAIDEGDKKADASVSLDATWFSIQARLGFSKGRRLRSGHIGLCDHLPSERG